MLRRCFAAFAATRIRRIAPPPSLHRKAVTAVARSRSKPPPPKKKSKTTTRLTGSKRRRRGSPRRPAAASSQAIADPEGEKDKDVSLKSISVSFVVPQEPPVRSRYVHPTDFLGSTDALMLTPEEKAEAAEAKAGASAMATAAAAAAEAVEAAKADPGTSLVRSATPKKAVASATTSTKKPSRKTAAATASRSKNKRKPHPKSAAQKKKNGVPRQATAQSSRRTWRRAPKSSPALSAQWHHTVRRVRPLSGGRKRWVVGRTAAAKIHGAAAATRRKVKRGKRAVVKSRVRPSAAAASRRPAARTRGVQQSKKPTRRIVAKSLKKKNGKGKK
ncbi:hypothetical protein ABB37_08577 [Leptomonas pyrrhocoris]|uniref:Uncharacterized protein n=1 Tax=Leptomonas pyrrhocoris TaxID=157538 RepID=A0A0M9FT14_LEPPY|nr:hypothetical protein ABB37_08577 [Leptomonas pyrrhocoris]KPA75276.1 hypothetical protein ABB37_08577 [Leptomonas pyrrhocoris]|eukprot:XP_015653715.1 hypothetical protein ABB37_08577 [Leptomonas pyrrhocoris]